MIIHLKNQKISISITHSKNQTFFFSSIFSDQDFFISLQLRITLENFQDSKTIFD
jgi:hypothetical protein